MKEFDNLSGELKPDYPKPKVPKELQKVGSDGQKKVKLNFSDFLNILLAILRNKALTELNPTSVEKVSKVLTYISIIINIILGVSIILLLI